MRAMADQDKDKEGMRRRFQATVDADPTLRDKPKEKRELAAEIMEWCGAAARAL